MLFTRAGTALLQFIQWKAYAKLLKRELLDVCWWYFITGAARYNCNFLDIFALPKIFDMFFVSSPLNLVSYSFLQKFGSRVLKFASNHSWSRSNQRLDLADCPWKLYFFVFYFSFLLSESLQRIITTCAYNPCSIAILWKCALTSDGMFWGSFGLFIH